MKKYVKYAVLAVVAGIFIWTFVFLWQKSQPEVHGLPGGVACDSRPGEDYCHHPVRWSRGDEVEIKPQISGIIDVLYKDGPGRW